MSETTIAKLTRGVSDGLVYAAYLTATPDGRLVQLRLPGMPPRIDEDVKRGKCSGFSDDSRKRFMELLHTIRRDALLPAFSTLTMPSHKYVDPKNAKRFLATLFKRWKREGNLYCGAWRMEAHPERSAREKRPVVHFHLLSWGGWVEREELSIDWCEIVDDGDTPKRERDYWNAVFIRLRRSQRRAKRMGKAKLRERLRLDVPDYWLHLTAGTKVESIRSFRGVLYYASKYLTKTEEESCGEDAGRVWGVFNARRIPFAESVRFKLSFEMIHKALAFFRNHFAAMGWEPNEWGTVPRSIFCDSPGNVLRMIGVAS